MLVVFLKVNRTDTMRLEAITLGAGHTLANLIELVRGKVVIICGPTASGKSALALQLGKTISSVIINADAMQVYSEIPIITGQPSLLDLQAIEHMLYGVIECGDQFSVGRWLAMAHSAILRCLATSKTPILVGGSGLYIKALVDGMSYIPNISETVKQKMLTLAQEYTAEELHNMLLAIDLALASRLSKFDCKRIMRGLAVFFETGTPLSNWQEQNFALFPREDLFLIHVNAEREEIYNRCDLRLLQMIADGAIDEVQALERQKPDVTYPRALGLYEIISYLKAELSLEQAIARAQQYTRNYAKRQQTWFKHQLQYDLVL